MGHKKAINRSGNLRPHAWHLDNAQGSKPEHDLPVRGCPRLWQLEQVGRNASKRKQSSKQASAEPGRVPWTIGSIAKSMAFGCDASFKSAPSRWLEADRTRAARIEDCSGRVMDGCPRHPGMGARPARDVGGGQGACLRVWPSTVVTSQGRKAVGEVRDEPVFCGTPAVAFPGQRRATQNKN